MAQPGQNNLNVAPAHDPFSALFQANGRGV
jgi:hypothetical protein